MPADPDGDLTVGVSLVGLRNHLVDVAGNVRCEEGKLRCEVEHDGVSHLGEVVRRHVIRLSSRGYVELICL